MIPDKLEEEVLLYLSNGLVDDLIQAAITDEDSDWFFFEEAIKDFIGQKVEFLRNTKG